MGFKRLSGLYAELEICKLVNWWFRFLMSQTGLLPIANSEPIQLPSSSVNGLIKVQLFKFGLKFTESL